jgi:hypothetical protein
MEFKGVGGKRKMKDRNVEGAGQRISAGGGFEGQRRKSILVAMGALVCLLLISSTVYAECTADTIDGGGVGTDGGGVGTDGGGVGTDCNTVSGGGVGTDGGGVGTDGGGVGTD